MSLVNANADGELISILWTLHTASSPTIYALNIVMISRLLQFVIDLCSDIVKSRD